ncbi:PLP-dependent aminotransferase family protein [Burkholderia vietnamiensis]|uniref:MocR-like pyridoxine biosynthesis transcription factor PdxR n=1 Tax=Burkholderia vietnamiensis TaxID=60552 RepID=UPI000B0FB4F5
MSAQTPSLSIEIDRQHRLPVYLQICERFKAAIAAGHLRPGDRVPALRGLATQLNTARGTVEQAYTVLVDEGYLQMRGAAGTFVSPSLPVSLRQPPPDPAEYAEHANPQRASARSNDTPPPRRAQPIAVALSGEPRPLQPGLPALDAFPRKVWHRLVSQRARSSERALLGYPNPAGYRPLREHIATYLTLSRGVTCVPEQVFVTGGYRATLELILRSLARADERVWFEDPGYLLARGFLSETGVQLVPVPVDADGIDVERGMQLDAQARFALVTPSHQSPLGHTLSLSRRIALLDWAETMSGWILEDDYDSEFRYLGRPLPALKNLDRRDRVIYCSTFSKAMYPGLRLAYAVVPERAVERVERVACSMNAGAPSLLQAALADFIEQGALCPPSEAHARAVRRAPHADRACLAPGVPRAADRRIAGGRHPVRGAIHRRPRWAGRRRRRRRARARRRARCRAAVDLVCEQPHAAHAARPRHRVREHRRRGRSAASRDDAARLRRQLTRRPQPEGCRSPASRPRLVSDGKH